jgi:hypothetical protein
MSPSPSPARLSIAPILIGAAVRAVDAAIGTVATTTTTTITTGSGWVSVRA